MDTTLRGDQNQTKISQKLVVSDKFGVFAYYFSKLKLGTILNKSGITKTKESYARNPCVCLNFLFFITGIQG